MALIEAVNIFQNYDGKEILKNINLKVDRAEIFALIGPTGAGKTTLIRILDLIEPPYSGKTLFDGVEVTNRGIDRLRVRRRMSYVQQRPIVFTMNVYDNITCGLRWRHMNSATIKRKVEEVLELVGMTSYRDRNARTLSGGETQRVAIARALVTDPEVLFLDEPTANMDPISTAKIEEVLAHIIGERKTTIIMTTHNMSQGQRMADRVGVLVNGEILQTGNARDIFIYPTNREVAEFVGIENIMDGVIMSNEDKVVTVDVGGRLIEAISDYAIGEKVSACLRPEDVIIAPSKISSSARNSFLGEVTRAATIGSLARVEIDCGFPLIALITRMSAEGLGLEKGKQVYATFKTTSVHVLKREK